MVYEKSMGLKSLVSGLETETIVIFGNSEKIHSFSVPCIDELLRDTALGCILSSSDRKLSLMSFSVAMKKLLVEAFFKLAAGSFWHVLVE